MKARSDSHPIFSAPGAGVVGRRTVAMPDGRLAVLAAEGRARSSARPGLAMVRGLADSLEALSALPAAWADHIDLCVLLQVPAADCAAVAESAGAVARSVHLLRGSRDLKSVCESISRASGPIVVVARSRSGSGASTLGARLDEALQEQGRRRERTLFRDRFAPTIDHEIAFGHFIRARRPAMLIDRRSLLENPPEAIVELARSMACPLLLTGGAACAPPAILQNWLEKARGLLVLPPNHVTWMKAFLETDLLVALGARLTESELVGLNDIVVPDATIIQVHPEIWRQDERVQLFVNSYAGDFAASLLELLRRTRPDQSQPVLQRPSSEARALWRGRIERHGDAFQKLIREYTERTGAPIDPGFVAHQIVDAAPSETIFAAEGNGCGMWLWSFLWLRPILYPDLMASIGVSLGWCAGALARAPGQTVWVVLGDGSFRYQTAALAKLVEERARVVIFLFNNEGWGSIRLEQTFLFGGRYHATELPASNHASIAASMGLETIRVERGEELAEALTRAQAASGPLLVEVLVRRDSVPFAGLNFALAEIDYVLGQRRARFLWSFVRAWFRRRLPRRVLWILLRLSMVR